MEVPDLPNMLEMLHPDLRAGLGGDDDDDSDDDSDDDFAVEESDEDDDAEPMDVDRIRAWRR